MISLHFNKPFLFEKFNQNQNKNFKVISIVEEKADKLFLLRIISNRDKSHSLPF